MLAPAEATPTVADDRTTLIVAPGYSAPDALVERLHAALGSDEAALAIASPFARGGRLRDRSWLARIGTSWTNGYLSMAAHGELATIVGTVRLIRDEALARVRASAPGIDPDAEIVLEARRQGLRIVEVPVELERDGPRDRYSFANLGAGGARCWNRVRCALHYRPALWLALPGLLPGLLPAVIAALLLLHATPGQIALWTGVTLVVQYGSLAIFSWQTTSFVAKRWFRR